MGGILVCGRWRFVIFMQRQAASIIPVLAEG